MSEMNINDTLKVFFRLTQNMEYFEWEEKEKNSRYPTTKVLLLVFSMKYK